MATILLIVIYCGYIGLGVPDSLLGASWPAMYADFNLPLSFANFISVIVCLGSISTSFFSSYLINKFSTRIIVIISSALTAVALLGYSISPSFIFVCLFAIPLGLGAGAVDSSLNNYVALNYNANHMNYLHCFYGVGVSISPYLMSFALKGDNNWRNGFRYAFYLQALITLIILISYPLWNKVKTKHNIQDVEYEVVKLTTLFKTKNAMFFALAFFTSCGIEAICNVWGASFLVKSEGFSVQMGAALIVLYFAGLSLGRFFSGILSKKFTPIQLMLGGECLTAVAILLMVIPHNPAMSIVALFFVGFGNGPAYPNLMHIIPKLFGAKLSQAVIGFVMSFTYLSVLLIPILFGQIAERIDIRLFGATLLVLFTIMIVNMLAIRKSYNLVGKEEKNEI